MAAGGTAQSGIAPHRDLGVARAARSVLDVSRAVATIRRLEFYVVELTIFAMPLFVVADRFQDLRRGVVFEGLVMYFLLYAVGDMINCLADRELDVVYKTRFSVAVQRIGVRALAWLIAAQSVAGLALAVHLSIVTGRWQIVALVLVGLFLGLGYSLEPLRFKGRGLGHLTCLWLLLYFLPMLCAGLLIAGPSAAVLAVAAGYATVEMGIVLVNTSEDLMEDRAAGIRTTTVAIGLPGTTRLAATLVAVGGAGFCGFWLVDFAVRHVPPAGYAAVGALVLACALVLARLIRLDRNVRAAADERDAMRFVRAAGKLVPVYATLVGWIGIGCAVISVALGG